MKITHLFVLALLLAVPSFAADVVPHASTGFDGAEMLIPVAGRVQGAGGELFLTDLTTDNVSGSGWTVVAIQPRVDIQF